MGYNRVNWVLPTDGLLADGRMTCRSGGMPATVVKIAGLKGRNSID